MTIRIDPTDFRADRRTHGVLQIDLPEEIEDEYEDLFVNREGLKLGGWPSLVQSEIFWAPSKGHTAEPEFVFQVDSTDKGGWHWGHGGVAHFGRGTRPGYRDTWAFEWQCL